MVPEVISEVVRSWHAGDREAATPLWESWLPMIHYENRQCGLRATKVLMAEFGVISSETVRAPLDPLPAGIRDGLLAHARRRKPLVSRWARER
jgi:4-hydroxy-tetrahydrodipicolinate synthase